MADGRTTARLRSRLCSGARLLSRAREQAVAIAAGLACLSLAGCGYHIAGRADQLPKTIHTIAVPAFGNVTVRYRLTDSLPAAITREFISRTRYRVVADPNEADAVLQGAVVNVQSFPTTFDTETGRAAGVQLGVILQLRLVERTTGKVLYNQPSMEVRTRHEISVDPSQFFDESEIALARVSQQVARSVVTGILEAF